MDKIIFRIISVISKWLASSSRVNLVKQCSVNKHETSLINHIMASVFLTCQSKYQINFTGCCEMDSVYKLHIRKSTLCL